MMTVIIYLVLFAGLMAILTSRSRQCPDCDRHMDVDGRCAFCNKKILPPRGGNKDAGT